MAKKTWKEKLEQGVHEVKITEKDFADIPAGSKMLIATPKIIADYISAIPKGHATDIKKMRRDLAVEFNAEYTCPVTTGIFLRIVAEAAYEELSQGKSVTEITPFWRAIDKKTTAGKKLSFGYDFVREKREEEGLAA